jgi:hypothetical protein
MRTLLPVLLPWVLLAALPAHADIVHLADGTSIEGTVTDLGDDLRVERGPGAMTIPKRRVLRIETGPTPEERAAARAATLKPDDLPGRLAFAAWCREQGLAARARAEVEAVLALDPECEEARRSLGHERIDGRWVTFEEAQQSRGLVLHQGRWITVEERDVQAALAQASALRRASLDEIRQLLRRAAVSSDAGLREDARRRLEAFPADERRLPALEALVADDARVRAVGAAELGRAGDAACVAPLARRFVLDASAAVRQAASDSLLALKSPSTGAAFIALLQGGNLAAKVRAADGLAAFPDRRAVPALVAALAWAIEPPEEVSLTTSGPGSIAPPGPIVIPGGTVVRPPPGRTPPAGAGMLPPTRGLVLPRVVTSVRVNRDPAEAAARESLAGTCVRALRACSGEDYGRDASAWRGWWIRTGPDGPTAPGK